MKEMYSFMCLCILMMSISGSTTDQIPIKPNILGPASPNRPFVVEWNVESDMCEKKFGIHLNLSDFGIIHNPDFSWQGSALTIFYANQLGLVPLYQPNGTPVNGGLPQLGDLDVHLKKAVTDIENFIPNPDFSGPAVIDWEMWHPLFDRFASRSLYRNKSIEKVQAEHPDWSHDMVMKQAKFEYEAGAKTFLKFTLALGKVVRPKALWGYYLYPDCYNYGNKTFQCSNKTLTMNDEIQWLFDDSTGLFPSSYLGENFLHKKTAIAYVAYRMKEAMRVDHNRPGHISIPAFMYQRLTYRKETKFVELFDLRDSIGVTAMLGASGTVIWSGHDIANSTESCKILNQYILNDFGPFVKATSEAALYCSDGYCSSHGRCVFSPIPSDVQSGVHYLSVPEALEIIRTYPKAAYEAFTSHQNSYTITCQCYNGWSGKDCYTSQL